MKRLIIILLILNVTLFHHGCTKEENEKYSLTTISEPESSGSVNPSSGSFEENEEISILATPSKGYSFKMWKGDLSGNNNPHNFKILKDTEVIAVFKRTDSDQDGVPDDVDQCENTPEGQDVNETGCAESQIDSDNDGVVNSIDLCPETPTGEEVSENGCSASQLDSDEDGVLDDKDSCPDTPINDDVDENGCSESQKDSDNDGVTDDLDNCPGTPEDAPVDENGCSATQSDSDLDGVVDDLDNCNNTPTGESVDANGCSDSQKDTDSDGVTDDNDECPNTPNGEETDINGCSLSQVDTDSDGVNNEDDQCPDTPEGESVDTTGCSDSQKDSDGDGIMDDEDTCPDTTEGAPVNENGCSSSQQDDDNDGVSNMEDKCSDTNPGEQVDQNGCAISQKTYVPDDNFEAALIDQGYDDILDNYVITTNINTITTFTYQGTNRDLDEGNPTGINDLTGIEAFKELKSLHLPYNDLLIMDLSQNTKLEELELRECLNPNINLTTLQFLRIVRINESDAIENLDLSNNTLLEFVEMSANLKLKFINLKNGNNELITFANFLTDTQICIQVDEAGYSNQNWTAINKGYYTENCNASIGDYVQGGILFYIFQPGDVEFIEGEVHGLIVNETDLPNSTWAPFCEHPEDALYTDSIQNGHEASAIILAHYGVGNYAASICDQLILNGFSDWYLPSFGELDKMYLNIGKGASGTNYDLGNFSHGYWSTSEFEDSDRTRCMAVVHLMGSPADMDFYSKTSKQYLRACRKF